MGSREDIRQLLMRSKKAADIYMSAVRDASPLRYDFLREQLNRYVLAKFLLTEADCAEAKTFDALVEASLSKSMKVSPELVAQFDTAQSCDGATSAMAKKILLLMSIQRALKIELPATESARIKTIEDLSLLVWNTLAQQPEWRKRMSL